MKTFCLGHDTSRRASVEEQEALPDLGEVGSDGPRRVASGPLAARSWLDSRFDSFGRRPLMQAIRLDSRSQFSLCRFQKSLVIDQIVLCWFAM